MNWGYEGRNRPEVWGDLNSEYALCGSGHFQSPIDITRYIGSSDLRPLQFDYNPGVMELQYDGRMLVARPQPGSFLKYDGDTFGLLEIIFHTPSEHYIKSTPADLELQFRHVSKNGTELYLAVLGLEGQKHTKSQTLWENLPRFPGQSSRVIGFNPIHLLPSRREYFRYSGSQTYPPCKQGRQWIVLVQNSYYSHNQINQLAKILGNNTRPIQPQFSRIPLRSR